jgi:DNA-binding NtrC family response regulator
MRVGRNTESSTKLMREGTVAKRILSTSWNPVVLRTRNWVIESAGYDVVTTRESQMFLRLAEEQHFDAALIGDSIPIDLRVQLAKDVKQLNPTLPLVIICRAGEESRVAEYAQVIVYSTDQPELLIRAIQSAAGDTNRD